MNLITQTDGRVVFYNMCMSSCTREGCFNCKMRQGVNASSLCLYLEFYVEPPDEGKQLL